MLILGDINACAAEDQIAALEAAGYTDLAAAIIGDAACPFGFHGHSDTLDHALANGSLAAQVTGAAEWHINADALDDNLEFRRNAGRFNTNAKLIQSDRPFRADDHDPILVGLDLAPPSFEDVQIVVRVRGSGEPRASPAFIVLADGIEIGSGTVSSPAPRLGRAAGQEPRWSRYLAQKSVTGAHGLGGRAVKGLSCARSLAHDRCTWKTVHGRSEGRL